MPILTKLKEFLDANRVRYEVRSHRPAFRLWFGTVTLGPGRFHPLVLLYALSGSAMMSARLRIPKP